MRESLTDEKSELESKLSDQVNEIQEFINLNTRVVQNQDKYKKKYDKMWKF